MPRRKDDKTEAISALFGERVLVEPHGKNFIVTKLKPRRRKKSSEAQKLGEHRFTEAVFQAKLVLKDPKQKAKYERNLKGHRNAFQAAMSEFMKKKAREEKKIHRRSATRSR